MHSVEVVEVVACPRLWCAFRIVPLFKRLCRSKRSFGGVLPFPPAPLCYCSALFLFSHGAMGTVAHNSLHSQDVQLLNALFSLLELCRMLVTNVFRALPDNITSLPVFPFNDSNRRDPRSWFSEDPAIQVYCAFTRSHISTAGGLFTLMPNTAYAAKRRW